MLDKGRKYLENMQISEKSRPDCLFFKQIHDSKF